MNLDWIWYGCAGLLAGAAGSLGIGGGGILIVFLTLFFETDQLKAQGTNLLFFIPVAVFAVIIYARKGLLKWRPILFAAGCGLLGVGMGTALAAVLQSALLHKLFAGLLVLIGCKELFFSRKKQQ